MSPRRCLAVRPEPGCAATVARVERIDGWHGIGVPLTTRTGTDASMPNEAFDTVALTSAAAVPFLHALDRGIPVHAVGEATAEAARSGGFTRVRVGADGETGGDGAAMAAALVDAYAGRTILYPCAEDRRPGFEDAANANGIRVQAWPVYRTTAIADGADRLRDALSHVPDAVMLHAPSGARALADTWPSEWRADAVRWLAMSDAIADALPTGMLGQRHIAARPDETAMIDLLRSI